MAFSPGTMKILEKIYWFVGAFLLGIGVYIIWKQHKQVEAVLLTIIGAAALFYYWIKWFKVKNTADQWPPYISSCPDYLTLLSADMTGDSKPVCMDFVGVTRQPNVFKKADPSQIPQAKDPNYQSFVFTMPLRDPKMTDTDYNNAVCTSVNSKGLSWFGVCE
jgi:hypothetical protein